MGRGFSGVSEETGRDEASSVPAKIYTYDFAARSDNSRVLLDEGIASTPDVKAAKTTVGGQDILNLEHEDVIDDVVFAVVRTTDKDEAQEIYLIVNND